MLIKFLAYGLVALIQIIGIFVGSVMTNLYFNQYPSILFSSFFLMFFTGIVVIIIEFGKLLIELKKDQNELRELKKQVK